MPVTWSSATERKLLFALIDPKASPKWAQVARAMGSDYSGESCRQKYYKLRNETLSQLDGKPISEPTTPTKRKASNIEGPNQTPKKRIKKELKPADSPEKVIVETALETSVEPVKLEAGLDGSLVKHE